MKEKKPLVVVLSRNYSTGLSIIRSLGAAGYTVDLVANAPKAGGSAVSAASKYVRKSVEIVSKKVKSGGDEELLQALLAYAGEGDEKPVLFPTDDYTCSIMDLNRNVLSEHFIMPTIVGGEEGCLTSRMDKTFQGQLARKAGILTPQEWIFNLEEDIVVPEDMVYPCFCKPIESITGYKSEMARCNDETELTQHLKYLRKRYANRNVLVQEFLTIDNEIDLSGVCLDQEIIIPAIIKKTHVAQHEKGVTLAGRIVPFEELGEIKDKVIEMMKEYHYFGMFDLELNIVGDKIYFNEVNLRSGGPNYSYFKSGVNLPALYVKEALGERHTPEEEKVEAYGKSFVYEKVAWEDHMHGFMTKKELDDCINSADIQLLYNDEDPEPQKIFIEKIKKQAQRNKLRAIKKKIRRSVKKVKRRVKKQVRRVKRRTVSSTRKVYQKAAGYPQTKIENQWVEGSTKPRVLVAGRNYCSNLCMARSIGQAGYDVEIFRVFQVKPKLKNLMKQLKPDAYSRYVKAFHICVSKRKSSRIVKKLIKIANPDCKMVMIPVDDLVANIVDDHQELLSQYYILPNVDHKPGEINRLMSKEVQKEMAKEAGLPVLNSCVIRTQKGEFEIPDTVNYPCFIKPNISKNSSKSKMRKCESEEELRETLTEFSRKKDIEMVVEDFVEIKREYSILGVSTKDGVAGPGFFGAEVGGHKERRGVAMTGRILDGGQWQPLIDDINRFIETLNYEGLYDVDLIETEDGKMYFVEVNMRFGASGYAVTKSGVNLPGMYMDYIVYGKPIDTTCKVNETGKVFVSEKVMIEEYMKGFITWSELKNYMKTVDIHFVQDEQDPAPYKHFKKFYLVASVMRRLLERKEKKEQK